MGKMLEKTEKNFSRKIQTYGAIPEGVGWNSYEAQKIRYDQLTKLLKRETGPFSVCDYGCGYGYYCSYLNDMPDLLHINYTGIDLSEEMIKTAKKMYGENNKSHNFIVGSDLNEQYDYIVTSGIFNLRQGETDESMQRYMIETIHKFNDHAKKGFAWNALTKYSAPDKMRADLYYADPMFLFDYCKKNISRNVALLHDYDLYDFTVIVRK